MPIQRLSAKALLPYHHHQQRMLKAQPNPCLNSRSWLLNAKLLPAGHQQKINFQLRPYTARLLPLLHR